MSIDIVITGHFRPTLFFDTPDQLFAFVDAAVKAGQPAPIEDPQYHRTGPYRPANGTEGAMLEEKFCERCKKYQEGDGDCWIRTEAILTQIDEPGYPAEWCYQDGMPVCTAFEANE